MWWDLQMQNINQVTGPSGRGQSNNTHGMQQVSLCMENSTLASQLDCVFVCHVCDTKDVPGHCQTRPASWAAQASQIVPLELKRLEYT